jgi:glucose/arabinose dehydrogenase
VERVADIRNVYEAGESGLMGMEFHPEFASNGYVYLVHSYAQGGRIRNRLIRARYDGSTLIESEVLLDEVLGNTYHDGARLAVGPDGYLYMTTGDAGRERLAQDTNSLSGKILRLGLDGAPAPGNPFGDEVFSFGHRNAQGLVFHADTGVLFITEHGPDDNDEVATVTSGQNHGWPFVHGFCDGDVRGEVAFCEEHEVHEPLAAWTPTIAPAGADFYLHDAIPSLRGSLLFTTLAGSSLVVLDFDARYSRVVSQRVVEENTYGRLRDVLVGPDGTIYLATSNRDGRGRPASEDDRILRIRPR